MLMSLKKKITIKYFRNTPSSWKCTWLRSFRTRSSVLGSTSGVGLGLPYSRPQQHLCSVPYVQSLEVHRFLCYWVELSVPQSEPFSVASESEEAYPRVDFAFKEGSSSFSCTVWSVIWHVLIWRSKNLFGSFYDDTNTELDPTQINFGWIDMITLALKPNNNN